MHLYNLSHENVNNIQEQGGYLRPSKSNKA